jgi:hypothetical protein
MRRNLVGLAVLLALGSLSSPVHAQGLGSSDPFFLYYSWFLPRQQALAMQPRPANTVNAMATIRQDAAMADRANLYSAPLSRFDGYDPRALFDNPDGRRMGGTAAIGGSIDGYGPSRYYNRTSSYYPGLRTGRGVNPSIAVGAAGGGGGRPPIPSGASQAMSQIQSRAGMNMNRRW